MKNLKVIYFILFMIGVGIVCGGIKNVNASYSPLTSLTSQEISLYTAHPIKAVKAKNCATIAENKTNEWYKNYTTWQGNGDAFRHAYWSALMTKKIDRDFAYEAGLAHEGLSKGYSFSEQVDDTKMDISNNYSGRILGDDNSSESDGDLAKIIKKACSKGKLKRVRTYTSKTGDNTGYIDNVLTKYVGYYVATTDGGLK